MNQPLSQRVGAPDAQLGRCLAVGAGRSRPAAGGALGCSSLGRFAPRSSPRWCAPRSGCVKTAGPSSTAPLESSKREPCHGADDGVAVARALAQRPAELAARVSRSRTARGLLERRVDCRDPALLADEVAPGSGVASEAQLRTDQPVQSVRPLRPGARGVASSRRPGISASPIGTFSLTTRTP
jgi:hypothetical protein